ncbi:F-box and WD repeat domain containing protein 10B [Pangasianodon hypophthalmus]|uniref:F-box and WD repeat domain containing protein 10B n=1 Tax=Pangasianodon hypophthalmus TaxID=310915 RepID=UPI0023079BED|nr:F-box and WD repeat domain containing protein 10B [Pangasianodon hypophthalmus]
MCVEMQRERRREESSCLSCKAEKSGELNTSPDCCHYTTKLYNSTQWLTGAGESARRRFLTGVLVRCESLEILQKVQKVLQVTMGKDFTYTRSRVKAGDMAAVSSSNSAPDTALLGKEMLNTWEWFKNSPSLTKTSYLLGLLAFCDAELLHMLGNLARVLVAREKRNLNFLRCNTAKDSSWKEVKEVMLRGQRLESSDADWDDVEDPALMVVPRSSKSMSGVSQHRDFIRALPVGLAKRILGLLDKATLQSCKHVSQHWQYLTEEIIAEHSVKKMVEDQAVILQGTPSAVNPVYARIREVLVPIGKEEVYIQPKKSFLKNKDIRGFESVYTMIKTKVVEMEERNVYCGVYNISIMLDREDPSRVIHYGGGRMVALGSRDRSVRLLDTMLVKEVPPLMHGHAGSVRAVLVCEERELVISASYDLSIRCWNLKTGACVMLFSGHMGTITCLDLHGNHLVSGARDCKVKVWSLQTGQCCDRMRFRHRKAVVCVKTDSSLVLSGCEGGLIKMWDMETATLLKVTQGHQGSVKCLFFDQFHILSGGSDGQVMAWSADYAFKTCLMTFQHPREVLTLSSLFLRVITGCVDGRIRIFSLLSGDCLRVIKIGTDESPIRSLHTHHNTIVVNSSSRVLILQFADQQWDYNALSERKCITDRTLPHPKHPASASSSTAKKNERRSRTPSLSQRMRSNSAPSMQHSHEKRYAPQKCVITLSERAVRERVRKRGPHQPITTTKVLLKVRPSCQPECKDLATSNMELNAAVRDAWGPPPTRASSPPPALKPSKRPHSAPKPSSFKGMLKIYTPLKTHTLDLNLQHSLHPSIPSPALIQTFPKSRRPQTACGVRQIGNSTNTTNTAQGDIQCSGNTFTRSELKHVGHHVDFEIPRKSRQSQNPLDPFRESGGFQLRTDTQLEEYKQAQMQVNTYTLPKEEKKRQCRTSWKLKIKVAPIKALELGEETFT